MGVVNVTPDSFSDGGACGPTGGRRRCEHGLRRPGEGADLLDVGGEATNPRAQPIDADAEIGVSCPSSSASRPGPARRFSVDTTKAAVARADGSSVLVDAVTDYADPYA